MFLSTPSCILTMTQCSHSRLRWMYALHAEGVGVHLYVILATVSSGPAARSVLPQFPDWLTWDNLSELSEMAWSDFFLHLSPALRNEIRRSQIDGWLTGVDRHIALTSVKKLRRANRWLSPPVQLFPFADTDCCACKKIQKCEKYPSLSRRWRRFLAGARRKKPRASAHTFRSTQTSVVSTCQATPPRSSGKVCA